MQLSLPPFPNLHSRAQERWQHAGYHSAHTFARVAPGIYRFRIFTPARRPTLHNLRLKEAFVHGETGRTPGLSLMGFANCRDQPVLRDGLI